MIGSKDNTSSIQLIANQAEGIKKEKEKLT
jgi:hypothetical protein